MSTEDFVSTEGLMRAAEDHFLHGHLLSSWIVDYVDLEESLAVGSLAQEDLAHAALLLELAGCDLAGRDAFIYERPIDEWMPTRLVTHGLHQWPATVVRGLLVASAAIVRCGQWAGADSEALRAAALVMRAEQELHETHWRRWVTLLGADVRTAAELGRCAAAVLPLATDLFGDGSLHRAWLSRMTHVLVQAGVPVDAVSAPRPRVAGGPELAEILGTVRALRDPASPGVRGLYR
jgi:1,2-phenylacetyl-CoA epoxidase catalytic subunit